MKPGKIVAFIYAGALMIALAGSAQSQPARHPGPSPIRMMERVLEKAGCPLSESQLEQIKNIEPGPGAREKIFALLDDSQKAALQNGPKGRIAVVLQKAGCPLTEEQKKQLRNKNPEVPWKDRLNAVLTQQQLEVLKNRSRNESSEELQKPAQTEEQPKSFSTLKQNYPNPFNPSTTIEYYLAKPGTVKVEIFSPNGQLISTLVNGYKNAGTHSVVWDGSSYAGGVYLCRITSSDFTESRKMTLVK